MSEPWHGTHEDRPDWTRPNLGVLLVVNGLIWGSLGRVGWYVWRRLR